jgi:hypothetical protein
MGNRMGEINWGTVPAWISGIGGSASLLLAFYILIRDRAAARASQASLIACWEHKPPVIRAETRAGKIIDWEQVVEEDTVYLHNASDRPITMVRLFTRSATRRELPELNSEDKLDALRQKNAKRASANLRIGREQMTVPDTVMPGERLEESLLGKKRFPPIKIPPVIARRWISFKDATGQQWCRDLQYGDLFRTDSLIAARRLTGERLLPVLVRRYLLRQSRLRRFPYWH